MGTHSVFIDKELLARYEGALGLGDEGDFDEATEVVQLLDSANFHTSIYYVEGYRHPELTVSNPSLQIFAGAKAIKGFLEAQGRV